MGGLEGGMAEVLLLVPAQVRTQKDQQMINGQDCQDRSVLLFTSADKSYTKLTLTHNSDLTFSLSPGRAFIDAKQRFRMWIDRVRR